MIKTSLTFRRAAPHGGGIEIYPSALHPRDRTTVAARSRVRMCDFEAPAGLYIRKGTRLRYLGFSQVSLAVRYANEELTSRELLSCTMEVEDGRFDGTEIRGLYHSDRYPFRDEKVLDS